jgi:hypothetical protein
VGGSRPDRWDITGVAICLADVGIIVHAASAPYSLVARICPQSKDGHECDAHRSGDSCD